jgi:hypothetical protein
MMQTAEPTKGNRAYHTIGTELLLAASTASFTCTTAVQVTTVPRQFIDTDCNNWL